MTYLTLKILLPSPFAHHQRLSTCLMHDLMGIRFTHIATLGASKQRANYLKFSYNFIVLSKKAAALK